MRGRMNSGLLPMLQAAADTSARARHRLFHRHMPNEDKTADHARESCSHNLGSRDRKRDTTS